MIGYRKIHNAIVIGSGPAAIAAAHALVHQGISVTVLDIGKQIEPDAQRTIERMAVEQPADWSHDDLARVAGDASDDGEDLHIKRAYGSRFCFAGGDSPNRVDWNGTAGFRHSDAEGGLSNVWGAALLPYRQDDISDWPISIAELDPHYRAVMGFLPSTAVTDDLEEILPSYAQNTTPLAPSRQGADLLRDLGTARTRLRASGIHFGRSRLAIQANGSDGKPPCAHCGLCLAGCPYSLIYQSTQTLRELENTGRLTYRKAHLVQRLEERNGRVDVIGKDLENGGEFRISAERVFLAAGSLPTAKIVLSSLGHYDQPITLKDSQYFILPLLRFGRVADVETERLHTSAQVFMEMDDPSISRHLVHMQVYGYSSILARELGRTFMRQPMKIARIRRELLDRLMVIQGFLHSNDSGNIQLVLQHDADGGRLTATTVASQKARKIVGKAARKLAGHARFIRAIPLLPVIKFPSPGSGYHSGGSFPMASAPGELETDSLGRLRALPRVHLIDSSVFPTIPATSITLTVMANAHRIATAAAKILQP